MQGLFKSLPPGYKLPHNSTGNTQSTAVHTVLIIQAEIIRCEHAKNPPEQIQSNITFELQLRLE